VCGRIYYEQKQRQKSQALPRRALCETAAELSSCPSTVAREGPADTRRCLRRGDRCGEARTRMRSPVRVGFVKAEMVR
jgi:hypothetical protein